MSHKDIIEKCARIVERHMGPIETYNPGYRDWMKCAQEIRALACERYPACGCFGRDVCRECHDG